MRTLLAACLLLVLVAGCQAPVEWSRLSPYSPSWWSQQSRVQTFEDPQGRVVTLVSEIHLGTPEYWRTIEESLSGHQLILFEGVVERLDFPEDTPLPQISKQVVAHIRALPPILDPVTGLTARRSIFPKGSEHLWADVAYIPTLQDWMRDEGASLYQLLRMLDHVGRYAEGRSRRPIADLLRREGTTLPDAALYRVLIERRNERVLELLEAELQSGRSSVAIHYGALHGPGLAAGIERLGFEPRGRERWLDAFTGQLPLEPGRFPREGGLLQPGQRLWVEASPVRRAEIEFVGFDGAIPTGRVRLEQPEGVESGPLVLAPDRPIRLGFLMGRAHFLGWSREGEGLRLRYDPPPPEVAPYRYRASGGVWRPEP